MSSKYEAVSQSTGFASKGSPLSQHRAALIVAAVAALTVIVVVAVVLPVYFDVINKSPSNSGLITYRLPLLSNLTESVTGLDANYYAIYTHNDSYHNTTTNTGPFFYCFLRTVTDICSANDSALYFGWGTYIALPTAIANLTSSYTISFWLWPLATEYDAYTGNANHNQSLLYISNPQLSVELIFNPNPRTFNLISDGAGVGQTQLTPSQHYIYQYEWEFEFPFHVAMTFNNASLTSVVYLNAVPLDTAFAHGWNGGGPLLIGGDGVIDHNFGGYMRYFTWSNYAWDAEQVAAEYNATVPSWL